MITPTVNTAARASNNGDPLLASSAPRADRPDRRRPSRALVRRTISSSPMSRRARVRRDEAVRPAPRHARAVGSPGGHSPPRAAMQAPLDHDGDDEDPAVDDLQPCRVDLEREQQVLEQVDRERREDDPDQPAATAAEAGPAEDDGGDRDERVLLGRRGVGRVHQELVSARARRHRRSARRGRSSRCGRRSRSPPAENAVASFEPTA